MQNIILKLSFWITLGVVIVSVNMVNYLAIALDINNQENQPSQEENLGLEANKLLIVGLWRGFHQQENFTMYYAYNFRPDGSYLARHRVYQQEETIHDEFWEGKWNLEDKMLRLEGVSQKGNKSKIIIRFQLTDAHTLQYYDSSLTGVYIPLKMNKTGSENL